MWFHNTYPGAACDVPWHLYAFSFEPKADWTRPYASQPEIRACLQDCADTYRPAPHLASAPRSSRRDATRRSWSPRDRAALTPTDGFSCNRPMVSNDHYPTFNRPNAELVTAPIVAGACRRGSKPTGVERARLPQPLPPRLGQDRHPVPDRTLRSWLETRRLDLFARAR